MSDNKVETELLSQIKEVLLKFPKYWEKDLLLRNKVAEDLRGYNQELIEALLSNQLVKDTYSITLNSTNIFKIEEFISMLRYKNYWENSYTKYSNEIGLTSEGKYLNYNTDVVLDFPHKDSVLEGGMTKEDQGKEEVYYHNVLAKEEIDTLLSPKVLTNIRKYDKNGEHDIDDFTDKDNLIIKGNNLVALHSLKEKYTNKVKLIYIDPPYNTGNDGFNYNDSFNRSTWLTFMKNRLEIAKELLSKDGIILVQCDDNEQAYLKVLMDEIFEGGFLNCIAVKMSEATGVKMSHANLRFPKLKEYILIYKMENFKGFYELDKYKDDEWDDENNIFIDNLSFEDRQALIKLEDKKNATRDDVNEANKILSKCKIVSLSNKIDEMEFKSSNQEREWLFENSYRIIKTAGSSSLKKVIDKLRSLPDQDIAAELSSQNVLFFYITDYNKNTAQPRLRVIFADKNLFKNPCDFWQDIKTSGAISKEGGVDLSNGKKPEKLVHRIIKMMTKEGDIVLDFFAGSGTTGAVAHKMNRQFILCEQLDKHCDLSIERLKNVINGDQTGVSKIVDWKGGGSFVYAELYSLNEKYVKDIQVSNSEEDLEKVLTTMKESAYLNFKVDLEKVSSKNEGYNNLSLEEKKEVLIQVLDMNQLYLSYSEMEDEQYNIPEDVKAFNHSFYQKEGVKDE